MTSLRKGLRNAWEAGRCLLRACLEAGLDIGERLNVQPSWLLVPAESVNLLLAGYPLLSLSGDL